MQIFISDANVLIDMQEGRLDELMFKLPFTFAVSDLLYNDELADQHGHFLKLGLVMLELDEAGIVETFRLVELYRRPSVYDCQCLVLAKQNACTLLTGDKELKQAASREKVNVKGTIWLVEQLIITSIISVEEARESYSTMRLSGSRLPWEEAERRLKVISKTKS